MTCCMAVSRTAVVVSSIDSDKCFAYPLDGGNAIDLTERLGEAYGNAAINNRDLQKACAAFSADGTLFAYNPNKGKLLSVWKTADWSLVGNRTLAKHATSMVFTPRTRVIVVGDKKGDVYAFDPDPVPVLGHSSMILDVCFSSDEKHIVTCDSDEKVRVSRYPNGKIIVHYMMGHQAYVGGVCVLNDAVLSGSGDGTLRLWHLKDGDLLDKLVVHAPVQSVVALNGLAAVQLYESNEVYIIKIERQLDDKWLIRRISTVCCESNVSNLAACGDQLWVMAGNCIQNYGLDSKNGTITKNKRAELAQMFKALENLAESFIHLENTNLMTFLYKKMIDKQNRTNQCANNDSPILHHSKKLKTVSIS